MRVTLLGAGSWGTALSIVLSDNGHDVVLWEFDADQAERVSEERTNRKFLPGIELPSSVSVTSAIDAALERAELVVFVVPSHAVRQTAQSWSEAMSASAHVVCATKGLEEKTLLRMSEVIEEVLGMTDLHVTSLVGPSHAEEVARRIPTAIVAASLSESEAEIVQQAFMNTNLRVYTSSDITGVELGVSLKNTVAIAAGICDGLGFGDNTKGALLTRGLAEITRLGIAMGARPETFMGLSGMGDLITTAISKHSRNRYVGQEIAKGRKLTEILESMVMVAEGVRTTRAATELAKRFEVELPITEQMYQVLFENKDPQVALRELMERQPKPEATGMNG
jgi:glycerol-3-phosphate dehydrogenase (NAD(P)+)